jgi:hypothetical protein
MVKWLSNKFVLGFLVFIAFIVFFIPIISQQLVTRIAHREAEKLLASKVEIAHARLHLLEGKIVVSGLKVYNPLREDETYIEADAIELSLAYSPLIFRQLLQIKLVIDDPRLIYETDRSGNWILSKKIPLMRRGKKEEEGRLPVFNVEKIVINDGEVEYRDGKVTKQPTVTKLDNIDLKVTNVRLPTEDEKLPAKFDLEFRINKQAKYHMEGRADFLSPKISFVSDISLRGLSIPPFAPYYDTRKMPVRVTRGILAMKSHAVCEKDYLNAPAAATISDLEVEPKGRNILGLRAQSVVDGLKDQDGNMKMDMLISGNIRSPQFHITTQFSNAFAKAFASGLVDVGKEFGGGLPGVGKDIEEGTKGGLDKLKGLFR